MNVLPWSVNVNIAVNGQSTIAELTRQSVRLMGDRFCCSQSIVNVLLTLTEKLRERDCEKQHHNVY
nr:MAG TPA: hypothetical protein [Caudoviricetes sp.]